MTLARNFLIIIALCSSFTTGSRASEGLSLELEKIQERIAKQEAAIYNAHAWKRASLLGQYFRHLDQYGENFKRLLNLSDLKRIEVEKKLILKDPYFEQLAPVTSPEFIRKLRLSYLKMARKMNADKEARMTSLMQTYSQELHALHEALLAEGRADEAGRVKARQVAMVRRLAAL